MDAGADTQLLALERPHQMRGRQLLWKTRPTLNPLRRVEHADEGASSEEETCNVGVAMDLVDGLGEDGVSHGTLLTEMGDLGESVGIGDGAVVEPDGVEYLVAASPSKRWWPSHGPWIGFTPLLT